MKPFAIKFGSRIVLISGNPRNLEGVALARSSRGNLVLVKVELDS